MLRTTVLLLFIVLGVVLLSCSPKKTNIADDVLLLPENSNVFFQIHQKDNFLSAIENNIFWKENSPQKIPTNTLKVLKTLSDQSTIWLSFTDKDVYVITQSSNQQTPWDTANNQVKTTKIGNYNWQYFLIGKQLVITTDENANAFTEQSFGQHPLLTELIATADRQCIASVYMTKSSASNFFSPIFETDVTSFFQNWLTFDVFLDGNDLRLSGTAFIDENHTDVMLHTQPYQIDIATWLPSDAMAITSYTFSDFPSLSATDTIPPPLLPLLNALTIAKTQNGNLVILSVYDGSEAIRTLSILSEEIQTLYSLYELTDDFPLKNFIHLFHSSITPRWIGRIENTLYLSNNKETVQNALQKITQGQTLTHNTSYKELEKEMASAVSITHIINLSKNTTYKRKYPTISSNYNWATLQLTPQNEYYIFNFISKKQSSYHLEQNLQEKFTYISDANIITPPTIILNHRTKRKEIVVQDEDFNLLLIGNNGSLLWKKKLDSKIQSPIYQVDLFKNGFLQMAFTTERTLWVVDRNGKNVAPFPKKFKQNISPLEITDYEGNLDYRFLFTEEKKLHLLDKKGQYVSGFSHQTTDGIPKYTPKHFRTQQKDYLIYTNEKGNVKILHRNGDTRIPISQTFDLSDNPPLLWNNQFVLSLKNGNKIYITTNGKITQTKENSDGKHHTNANHYLFTQISDNTLEINHKKYSIPFGEYTPPKLFRVKGQNYIASLEKNTSMVYLWNEKGQILMYFPTEATQQIDIAPEQNQIWIAILQKDNQLTVLSTNQLTAKQN